MRLRARGWLLRETSDELGFGDVANVRRALARHTEAVTGEAAAELRQAQLEQFDNLTAAAVKVLETKHLTFQQGRLCTVEVDGEKVPVEDDAPVLRAVETLLPA